MWGEFEEDKIEEKETCFQLKPTSEEAQGSQEESKTPEDTTTKEDDTYVLPLRDRLVNFLAASSIEVKSQQRYEPDLTYEERKEIIENLLEEKPGQFLYRFGKHLEQEHLHYFQKYEGDVEVDYFLAEALKYKNKHTAKITVRNRRYAALQKMRRSGDYFSEQEMERRDPLLYDYLIGQHQTEEEREEKHQAANTTETKFSSLLLHHIDNREHKELKKQKKDQEDDMFEEEDTDEEDEYDEDVEMDSAVDSREKQMFKEEFYSAGYNNFLRGQNKDFDYKEVDNNDAYDLLDIRARDEEERYFDDEEEVACNDMEYGEENES